MQVVQNCFEFRKSVAKVCHAQIAVVGSSMTCRGALEGTRKQGQLYQHKGRVKARTKAAFLCIVRPPLPLSLPILLRRHESRSRSKLTLSREPRSVHTERSNSVELFLIRSYLSALDNYLYVR